MRGLFGAFAVGLSLLLLVGCLCAPSPAEAARYCPSCVNASYGQADFYAAAPAPSRYYRSEVRYVSDGPVRRLARAVFAPSYAVRYERPATVESVRVTVDRPVVTVTKSKTVQTTKRAKRIVTRYDADGVPRVSYHW